MSRKHMPTDSTTDPTLFDTLTAVQQQVLQALVAGQSISAAANQAGIHRSTVHLWTQKHPDFARVLLAARHHRADCLMDELADLAGLALDTFRQILSDGKAPAATRLKAAIEIVKLVEAQRPTFRETTITEVQFDRVDRDLQLHQVAEASQPAPKKQIVGRNAPCPCGSPLKYKRCCGNPVTQTRAA